MKGAICCPPRGVRVRASTFELRRDLLQCPIRRRRLDARHQLNQPIVARLRSRTIQQCRLDHSFRHPAVMLFTAEALSGPRRAIAAIQERTSDDIALSTWLIWPHPTNCWQPGFELFEDTIEVGGGTAGPDFPDRVRVTGAQPGIAPDPATRARGVQPGFRPLGDQRPFELRDGSQHLQGEHALRRRRIDGVMQAAEMRAIGLKLLNNSQQMADRPREPVESDYDQRFTGADLAQQARQDRPGSIGARRVFLQYRFAARGAKCRSSFRASVCPFGVQWIRYLLADISRCAVSYAALMRSHLLGPQPPLSGWRSGQRQPGHRPPRRPPCRRWAGCREFRGN